MCWRVEKQAEKRDISGKGNNGCGGYQKIRCTKRYFWATRLISDRGSAFTSSLFKDYCRAENINHILTTTGVPRGNGQVERINGVIVPALTKLAIRDPTKWYKHAAALQRYINSTNSRSTGRTPFQLMFGTCMRNPEDLQLARALEEAIMDDFEAERCEMREAAKLRIEKNQEENRLCSNRWRKVGRKYSVGDTKNSVFCRSQSSAVLFGSIPSNESQTKRSV